MRLGARPLESGPFTLPAVPADGSGTEPHDPMHVIFTLSDLFAALPFAEARSPLCDRKFEEVTARRVAKMSEDVNDLLAYKALLWHAPPIMKVRINALAQEDKLLLFGHAIRIAMLRQRLLRKNPPERYRKFLDHSADAFYDSWRSAIEEMRVCDPEEQDLPDYAREAWK